MIAKKNSLKRTRQDLDEEERVSGYAVQMDAEESSGKEWEIKKFTFDYNTFDVLGKSKRVSLSNIKVFWNFIAVRENNTFQYYLLNYREDVSEICVFSKFKNEHYGIWVFDQKDHLDNPKNYLLPNGFYAHLYFKNSNYTAEQFCKFSLSIRLSSNFSTILKKYEPRYDADDLNRFYRFAKRHLNVKLDKEY